MSHKITGFFRFSIILSTFVFLGFSTILTAATNRSSGELIQIAILLDTSSSMDGLIEQAKSSLWKTVNELALAKRNGHSPRLEVAIWEYGNDGLPEETGHMRLVQALTSDLDKVSEELFKLKTNGGDEFCGQVIGKAVDQLNWSKDKTALKLIFIAGNEPFTQGQVNYTVTCKKAIEAGIIVNTIFCGGFQEGIGGDWKQGADLADGRYMNIDQNQQTVSINAPQDAEILKLGDELNKTYIAYSASGKAKKERQAEQDKKASAASPESAVQRSLAKAAPMYAAGYASEDLVNASADDAALLSRVDKDQLPEEMKNMTPEQRKQYVDDLAKKRQEIQKRLEQLNVERRKYVEAETKKLAEDKSLDSAVMKAVREQAAKKNFEFGN